MVVGDRHQIETQGRKELHHHDVAGWQTDFARAVIDAGASMYVGHGHRGFDGIEIYKGRPLIRQLGGFAYQGLQPEIGSYRSQSSCRPVQTPFTAWWMASRSS